MRVILPKPWLDGPVQLGSSSSDWPRSFQTDDPVVEMFIFPYSPDWPVDAVREALCLAVGHATVTDPALVRLEQSVVNWRGLDGHIADVVATRDGAAHGFSWCGRDASVVAVGEEELFSLPWVSADLTELTTGR